MKIPSNAAGILSRLPGKMPTPTPTKRGVWSPLSILSALSVGSLLSFGSVLSVGSAGSILSIGSAGSILSIGRAGSILSIGGRAVSTRRQARGEDST